MVIDLPHENFTNNLRVLPVSTVNTRGGAHLDDATRKAKFIIGSMLPAIESVKKLLKKGQIEGIAEVCEISGEL